MHLMEMRFQCTPVSKPAGCIMLNYKCANWWYILGKFLVVLPLSGRFILLVKLHVGHPGISRMKIWNTVLFAGNAFDKIWMKL